MRPVLWVLLACILAGAAAVPSRRAEAIPAPQYVYVHDGTTPNQVFAYRFFDNGTMSELAGSPFDANNSDTGCGGPCQTAVYSRELGLFFVGGGDGISVFEVNANGSLTLVDGSPFGATRILGLGVVRRGSRAFVYGSDVDNAQVVGFEVAADGTLAELASSPFPAGADPVGMTTSGSLVYVANEDDTSVSGYRASATGALTPVPGSPFALTGATHIFSLNAVPDSPFLYVPDCDDNQVFGFRIRTNGSLTALAGSPFEIGTGDACGGLAVRRQSMMFALSNTPDDGTLDIQALRRTGAGRLTLPRGPQSSGVERIDAGALVPTATFLVVAGDSNDRIRSLRVNQGNGKVTLVDTEDTVGLANVNAVVFARP